MTITEHTRSLRFAEFVMHFHHIRYILKLQTNQSNQLSLIYSQDFFK